MIPSLHIEKWMHPICCTPDAWFRWMVIFCGVYVCVVYAVFAYNVLGPLRTPLGRLVHKEFGKNLGMVFVFCAICHFAHSVAYVHQYFKLILFAYPALCFFHTRLLLSSKSAIRQLGDLQTIEDVAQLKSDRDHYMQELEKCRRELLKCSNGHINTKIDKMDRAE